MNVRSRSSSLNRFQLECCSNSGRKRSSQIDCREAGREDAEEEDEEERDEDDNDEDEDEEETEGGDDEPDKELEESETEIDDEEADEDDVVEAVAEADAEAEDEEIFMSTPSSPPAAWKCRFSSRKETRIFFQAAFSSSVTIFPRRS